jgi:hypothetical protein
MPILAHGWERYSGTVVGNGHCVPLLQHLSSVGHTSAWRAGERVQGAELPQGTCIATFASNGRYANAGDGSSHAAIYLETEPSAPGSIRVFDQWAGHPASSRTIRDKAGAGSAADDAGRYRTIEVAT